MSRFRRSGKKRKLEKQGLGLLQQFLKSIIPSPKVFFRVVNGSVKLLTLFLIKMKIQVAILVFLQILI